MVEFNPNINKVQSDYTGSSRYWDTVTPVANTAGAQLGEALGKTFGLAVGAVDESIQQNIRDEATQMSDSIYDEFGVGDAATQEADVDNPNQPAPVELERARENLSRLQAARTRGDLKESTFYARMTSMSRQLRARYPGYREQVDNIISDVTGIRPANSLRAALMNEFEDAAKNQSDSVKQRQQVVKEMASKGVLPMDYNQREASAEPYSNAELMARWNGIEAQERSISSQKSQLELKSAQGKATEEDARTMFVQESTSTVNQFINDTTSMLGKDWQSVNKQIGEISKRAAGGGLGATGDEQQQIAANLNNIKTQLRQNLIEKANAKWDGEGYNSYSKFIKPEEMNKMIDQALLPVQNIIDAVGAGQWNIFQASAAWSKATSSADGQRLMMGDNGATLRRHMAIKETLGPDAYNWYLGSDPTAQSEFKEAVRYSAKNKIVSGEVPLGQALEEAGKEGATSEDFTAILNNTVRVLSSFDESNMKAAQATTVAAFGPSNYNAFSKIEKADRVKFYTQLTSPQVTKSMQRLKDMGDTRSYEMYRQWSLNAFQALFRQQAQDIQQVQVSEAYKVAFSPTRNAFVPVNRDGTYIRPQSPAEMAELQRVNGVLNQFNQSVQSIVPLLEEEDSDVMSELGPLFQSMGLDLTAPQEGSLFAAMGKAIGEAFDSVKNVGKETDAEKQRMETAGKVFQRFDTQQMSQSQLQQEARPSSALPFNAEEASLSNEASQAIKDIVKPAEAPGGYNQVSGSNQYMPLDRMTLNEVLETQKSMPGSSKHLSSAVGQYQIIRSTLRGLKDKLGLSGDEMFTPELQDRLALELAREKGLQSFLEGKLSKERFADNLAEVWAGLPMMSGRSRYEGVGTNKATTRRSIVEERLDELLRRSTDSGLISFGDDLSSASPVGNEREVPLIDSLLPPAQRALLTTIGGETGDITEDFFTKEEREKLKEVVRRANAKGKKTFDYLDYSDDPLGKRDSISESLSNTLGQATFKIEEDGTIVIEDTYDFAPRWREFGTNMGLTPDPSLIEKFKDAYKGRGISGIARPLAEWAAPEGKGRKVKIKLK